MPTTPTTSHPTHKMAINTHRTKLSSQTSESTAKFRQAVHTSVTRTQLVQNTRKTPSQMLLRWNKTSSRRCNNSVQRKHIQNQSATGGSGPL